VAAADTRRNLHNRSRRVAFGGLLSALALLFIFLSAVSPTADLALMTVSSLCVAVAIMETGTTGALTVYAAVSVVASFWPGIAFAYPFVTFFGLFPLVKAFAEKRWLRLTAAIFKLLFSAVLIAFTGIVFLMPAIQSLSDRYGVILLPLMMIGALAVVLVYDYALSLLILLYQRRRPSLR